MVRVSAESVRNMTFSTTAVLIISQVKGPFRNRHFDVRKDTSRAPRDNSTGFIYPKLDNILNKSKNVLVLILHITVKP